MKESALFQLKMMVLCMLNEIPRFSKIDLYDLLGGYGQRLNLYKRLTAFPKQALKIDYELCTHCRRCYRMCPAHVIELDGNSRPYFAHKEDCIFCLKCYNLCPQYAVLIREASRNRQKFGRYRGPGEDFIPEYYR